MKFDRRSWLASGVAAALGALVFWTSGATLQSAEPEPKIEIIQVDGKENYQKALAKYKGKVVLVDFWATWCGVCIKRMPHNADLVKRYGDKGLVIVLMSMDENEDLPAVKKKLAEFALPQVVYMMDSADTDSQDKIDRYGMGNLPHYNIYDRSGTLVKEFEVGDPDVPSDPEAIESALKALFDKEKP